MCLLALFQRRDHTLQVGDVIALRPPFLDFLLAASDPGLAE